MRGLLTLRSKGEGKEAWPDPREKGEEGKTVSWSGRGGMATANENEIGF